MRPSWPSVTWLLPLGRPISTSPRLLMPPLITNRGLPVTVAFPEFIVIAVAVMVPPLLVIRAKAPVVGLELPPVGFEPTCKPPLMVKVLLDETVVNAFEHMPKLPLTIIAAPG